MEKKPTQFLLGVVAGAVLFGGIVPSAAAGIMAELSRDKIYVDGECVEMQAYKIGGSNYVRLRDIGEAVGFNVFWDGAVMIDSEAGYTGVSPDIYVDEQVPTVQSPEELARDVDVEAIRQEIITRTNQLRKENGQPELAVDAMLMRAAQVRADEMAATSVYSHTRPDGRPRYTVTDSLYTTENINIVSNYLMADPEQDLARLTMEDWIGSKSHLDGMLDSTRYAMGVGVAPGINPVTGQNCWYCVQWFLRSGCFVQWVDEPVTQKK